SEVVFFSSRRRHTRSKRDWSSDVCSSDLEIYINRLKELLIGEYESNISMKQMTSLQQSATKIEQLIKYQKEEYDYHRTKKESKAYIRKVEMAYHTNR